MSEAAIQRVRDAADRMRATITDFQHEVAALQQLGLDIERMAERIEQRGATVTTLPRVLVGWWEGGPIFRGKE